MGPIELTQAVISHLVNQNDINAEEIDRYARRVENLIAEVLGSGSTEYKNKAHNIYLSNDPASYRKGLLLNLLHSVVTELEFQQLVTNINSGREVISSTLNPAPNPPSVNNASTPNQATNSSLSNKVFVVHGRDEAIKQTVARWFERIKLDPIILHEQTNAGQTIMEKFINNSDVGCAVVLLTPDDMGITVGNLTDKPKPRARQNVIFEMGFFIGKLGRKHVFVLYPPTKDFEIHSDFAGVIYIEYDRPDGSWRGYLAKELLELGYKFDTAKVY